MSAQIAPNGIVRMEDVHAALQDAGKEIGRLIMEAAPEVARAAVLNWLDYAYRHGGMEAAVDLIRKIELHAPKADVIKYAQIHEHHGAGEMRLRAHYVDPAGVLVEIPVRVVKEDPPEVHECHDSPDGRMRLRAQRGGFPPAKPPWKDMDDFPPAGYSDEEIRARQMEHGVNIAGGHLERAAGEIRQAKKAMEVVPVAARLLRGEGDDTPAYDSAPDIPAVANPAVLGYVSRSLSQARDADQAAAADVFNLLVGAYKEHGEAAAVEIASFMQATMKGRFTRYVKFAPADPGSGRTFKVLLRRGGSNSRLETLAEAADNGCPR